MESQTTRAQERENKAQTDAEYRKTLLRAALYFEKFEFWRKDHSPESRSIDMDNLCQETADAILAAVDAGHFQSLPPSFTALADFYRGGLLPSKDRPRLEGYPPNYAPCAFNFIAGVKHLLMAEFPERFTDGGDDANMEVATALRILAGMMDVADKVVMKQKPSLLEREDRGSRLLRKCPHMTARDFAKAMGVPTTTARSLDCWKNRTHKNHAGRKPRVRAMDPSKLEIVSVAVAETNRKARDLQEVINDQKVDDRSNHIN